MEAVDILIADSDPNEAARVQHALRHIRNRLEVFTDPERAVDRLLQRGEFEDEQRAPDLILLDAELLGPGCYDLIKSYRGAELKHSVIAVLEADPDLERVERARKAGASAYTRKPLTLQSLAELLEDVEGIDLAAVRDGSLEVAARGRVP